MTTEIEALRALMRAAVLTGKGNYLPLGTHKLLVEKFFFKGPGTNTPMGLFISEFKMVETTNAQANKGGTYSEVFDLAKTGWDGRMKKFVLATLGVDRRGVITEEMHDLFADIRFSAQFESERQKLSAKYGHAPEQFLLGRHVIGEGTDYTTKKNVKIVSTEFSPVSA